MKYLTVALLSACCFCGQAAQAAAPIIFFTDLVTGANSGGEGGNGVYITLYGKNFGATQGSSTVSVGGATVVQYKVWGSHNAMNPTLDKVVVQIGPSNQNGNIVITVNGQASNSMPFTVSSGHIYFVAPSPSGSDSNVGTFAAPWATPKKAKASMVAGDTVYFRAGTYTTQDNFGSIILCTSNCSGVAGAYQNFVGYPGETAQIGDAGTPRAAIYNWGNSVVQYMTVAELTIRGAQYAMTCQNTSGGAACNYLRIIGNDMRVVGGGPSTAFDLEMNAANDVIYGNDSSFNCAGFAGCDYNNRSYSIYLGGYGLQSNIDIGWNSLHDNPFGKGVQVYGHIAGDIITGLKIHDNLIYNNTMVGVLLGYSDGGTEFVHDAQVYNNLFWNNSNGVGTDHMNYGAIQLQSVTASIGDYQVFNNTFYANSPAHNNGGAIGAGGVISFGNAGVHSAVFQNNIFFTASGAPCYYYFDDTSAPTAANVTSSNNLYIGGGAGPTGCNYVVGNIAVSGDAAKVTTDPQFANAAAVPPDFHLASSNSPASGAGVNLPSLLTTDFDGVSRPQAANGKYSIGAYEHASGAVIIVTTPPPAPPRGLTLK